jgi:quercetin dioxygenase-like cupin family protein
MKKLLMTFGILACVQVGAPILAEQGLTVTSVMKASTTIAGQRIEYPKTEKAEMTALLVELQPGQESGRHLHPVPTYVHVLEGTLTVEAEDGSHHTFEAGKGFLESVNVWHNGKNLGNMSVKFLVVFVGEEGQPNLIRPEKK